MKPLFILFLSFLIQKNIFSQGWEKKFDGIFSFDNLNGASSRKMILTEDGNLVVMGTGNSGIYIIKADLSGDTIWSRQIASSSMGLAGSAIINMGDGFLIGGRGGSSSILIRTDTSANVLWSTSFPDASDISAMIKSGATAIIAGTKNSSYSGVFVARINIHDGSLLWGKTLDSQIYPRDIAEAGNGGFVLLAEKPGNYNNFGNCQLMRFDAFANIVWKKSYSYYGVFAPHSMKLTSDGGYIIGGTILLKTDTAGDIEWIQNIGYFAFIRDLAQSPDGGYIAVSGRFDGDYKGIKLLKFDKKGSLEWNSNLGTDGDFPETVFPVADGYIIAGGSPLYLIKTDIYGMSGCNTAEPYSYLNFSPALCLVGNPAISLSNKVQTNNFSCSSNPASIQFYDPCCNATPIIDGPGDPCREDYYTFEGSGGPHLFWSTGDTGFTTTTTDTSVFLTIENTCGSFTSNLIIHPSPAPTFSYTISDDTICPGDSIILVFSGLAVYYACYADPRYFGTVKKLSDSVFALKPEQTTIFTLVGNDEYEEDCGEVRKQCKIVVEPDKPVIIRENNYLLSSSAINYQWFFNGGIISGSTEQNLPLGPAGFYHVEVGDVAGCINHSDSFSYIPDSLLYTKNAWHKEIGSPDALDASVSTIIRLQDGDLILASNFEFVNNQYDIVICKINPNGDLKWSKTYGGEKSDFVTAIVKSVNGFIITGSTESFGKGRMDAFLIEFDENGNLLWSKTYGDWNDQMGHGISRTNDGYIICGYSTNPTNYLVNNGWLADNSDLYLIRTDNIGNLMWSKQYHSSGDERGQRVIQVEDGGFYIAGSSEFLHLYLVRADSAGNLMWTKKIKNLGTEAMEFTAEGNLMTYSGKGNINFFNDSGQVIWSKKIEEDSYGRKTISFTEDNAVLLTSCSNWPKTAVLTKMDYNGNILWRNFFNQPSILRLTKAIQMADGSFMLSGFRDNYYDVPKTYLVKTDEYGETNCSEPLSFTITNDSVSYLNHNSSQLSLGTEMTAATQFYNYTFYSNSICPSKAEISSLTEEHHPASIKVFPNPSTGIINILFEDAESSVKIAVFEITGRTVYEKRISRTAFCQLDIGNKAKGMYFIEISTDTNKVMRKVVIE